MTFHRHSRLRGDDVEHLRRWRVHPRPFPDAVALWGRSASPTLGIVADAVELDWGNCRKTKEPIPFLRATSMDEDASHMRRYDPDVAPRASAWLALDEDERLLLVERYHERADPELPNVRLHASIHVVVENQLAEGYPPSRAAFERVRSGGLSRHDAIHAVGSVVAEHLSKLLNAGGDAGEGDPNVALERALNELTAEKWLAI